MLKNNPPQTPVTDHHRQIIWQVWIPLILAILVIIALAVLSILASSGNFSNSLHWANISLIMMILPATMIVVVFLLGVTCMVIYLLAKLLGIIPYQALRLQTLFFQVAIFIHTWSNKIIEPLVRVHMTTAAGKALLQKTGFISNTTEPSQSYPSTTQGVEKG